MKRNQFGAILLVGILFAGAGEALASNSLYATHLLSPPQTGDVGSGSVVYVKAAVEKSAPKVHERGKKDICGSGQCQRKKVLTKSVVAPSLGAQAQKMLTLGNTHLKNRKYADAVKAFQQSNKFKQNFGAYFGLAEASSELDKDAEALAAYQQAIKLNPNLEEAHYNLGVLQYEQKQYDAALKSLKQAGAIGKPGADEYFYLGATYRKLNRLPEAETNLREALKFNRYNGEAYLELGSLRYNNEKYDEALIEYRKAAEAMPNNPTAWMYIGDTLGRLGRGSERLEPYQKSLQLKPELRNDVNFSVAMSAAQMGKGNYKESLEWSTAAAKMDPKNFFAQLLMGTALIQTPTLNAPAAVEALNKAAALDPNDKNVFITLGLAYVVNNPPNFKQAAEAYTKAAALNPQNADVFMLLATAHFQKSPPDYNEAAQNARRSIQLKPDNAMAHFFLGSSLQQIGQHEQSLSSLKEAVRLTPASGLFRVQLCGGYTFVGRFKEALPECQEALKTIEPENKFLAHNLLGAVYLNLKRPDDARKEFETVIKIKPNSFLGQLALGELYYNQKKYDKAVQYLQQGIKLGSEPGTVNQFNMLYLLLGKVYWDSGRKGEAAQQFAILQNVDAKFAEQLKLYMLTNNNNEKKKR